MRKKEKNEKRQKKKKKKKRIMDSYIGIMNLGFRTAPGGIRNYYYNFTRY